MFLLHQHQLQESSGNLWHAKKLLIELLKEHICVLIDDQLWHSVRPALRAINRDKMYCNGRYMAAMNIVRVVGKSLASWFVVEFMAIS